jgi:hypothetical protein
MFVIINKEYENDQQLKETSESRRSKKKEIEIYDSTVDTTTNNKTN